MTSFEVHGSFDLVYEKRKGGRTLIFDGFWGEESEANYLSEEKGCYVFAIRNRGLTPIYVGKATRSFRQEAFNLPNRHKYQTGFSEYGKGTPTMYFVVHPTQRGRVNGRHISEVEDFLIQAGVARNPELQNVRGAQQPAWSIKGVVRSRAGKRQKSEVDFGRLFDIHT